MTQTVPRAHRSLDDRIIGGVAGGLARHLGLDPFPVRVTPQELVAERT